MAYLREVGQMIERYSELMIMKMIILMLMINHWNGKYLRIALNFDIKLLCSQV